MYAKLASSANTVKLYFDSPVQNSSRINADAYIKSVKWWQSVGSRIPPYEFS